MSEINDKCYQRIDNEAKGRMRNYKMDNIRFFLMFLVVFGHLLELFQGKYRDIIYIVIYTFHMPAFIFLSGYFARFNPKKILHHLVLPYLFFQILYLTFDYYVMSNREQTFVLQFTTPYWLLWYLLVMILYYLLIPVQKTDSKKTAFVIMAMFVLFSVLVGFDNTIGYYMSLSRMLVFFPFFAWGYYASDLFRKDTAKIHDSIKRYKVVITILLMSVVIILWYLVCKFNVSPAALYGSYSYMASGSSAKIRVLIGLCAVLVIIILLTVVPNKKLFLLSSIGQNTMPIYLFHGFLQRLISKYSVFHYSQMTNLFIAIAMTFLILIFLGNRFIGKIFKKTF